MPHGAGIEELILDSLYDPIRDASRSAGFRGTIPPEENCHRGHAVNSE